MSFWRELKRGLGGLMYRDARNGEIDEEVRHYFEEAVADYRMRGLSDEDARRAALRECGNPYAAREQVRTYGWENAVRAFVSDLRFAGRQLRRNPRCPQHRHQHRGLVLAVAEMVLQYVRRQRRLNAGLPELDPRIPDLLMKPRNNLLDAPQTA